MTDGLVETTLRRLLGGTDRDLLERFSRDRDEDAFGRLVDRYGPMVLGVCRRVLGNSADAEDVFQATFLILARKAGGLDARQPLGHWLYTVARNRALNARTAGGRRRALERRAAASRAVPVADPAVGDDWQVVLDEELGRLPEKYRAPMVLCYLGGKTNEQAARELGCPVGTVSGRLARARDTLRGRLSRRGLALPSVAGLSLLAAQTPVSASVPAELVGLAAGRATVRPVVALLVRGWFTGSGWASGAFAAGVLILGLAGVGVGPFLGTRDSAAQSEKGSETEPPAAPDKAADPVPAELPVGKAPGVNWQVSTLPLNADLKTWTENHLDRERKKLRDAKLHAIAAFSPQTAGPLLVERGDGSRPGSLLLYRDLERVVATNLRDGKFLWWHQPEGGLKNLFVDPTKRSYLEAWVKAFETNGPPAALLANAIAGGVATDGSRAFFVDDLALPPHPTALTMFGRPVQFGPLSEAVRRNTLKGMWLETGKLHWDLGGKFDNSEFKDTFFLGVPLAVDAKLYLLNEKEAEIRLFCLEPKDSAERPASPEVLWTTSLGKVANPAPLDYNRRTRPATFALAEGILVCVTNAGQIAAVDAKTGKPRWSFRYRAKKEPGLLTDAEKKRIAGWIEQLGDPQPEVRERAFAELEKQKERAEPALKELLAGKAPLDVFKRAEDLVARIAALHAPPAAGDGWLTADPVIRDGKIVFTAPDGPGVFCLRLADGELLWQANREDGLYLADVRKDRVVVVGTAGVRALGLEDGKLAWRCKTTVPAGYGIRFGPFYLLPVEDGKDSGRGELLVVDMASGALRGRFGLGEPLGNLRLAGDHLLSQTATGIIAYAMDGFGGLVDGESWPTEDQQELWNDLDAPNESRRERARQHLKAALSGIDPLLKKELRPATATDHKRLGQLFRDLEDPKTETRARAAEELEKLQDLAEPGLQHILESKPTLDLATRAEGLLKRLPAVLPAQRRTLWTLDALERRGGPEARALLERMAGGEPNSRITRAAQAALERWKQR